MTDPFRHDAAPYVLGALTPEERYAFEQHLETCTSCDADVRDFAGLPGLLARISDQDVPMVGEERAESDPPGRAQAAAPHLLLPALLGEVHRRRRTARWRVVAAGLVAACLAVLGVVVGLRGVTGESTGGPGGLAASRPATTPSAGPSPGTAGSPASPSVGPLHFHEVGDAPIAATAVLRTMAWGTQIEVRCKWYEGGPEGSPPTYQLRAVERTGASHDIADWQAVKGAEIVMQAATSVSRGNLAELQILDGAGKPVLSLPL